MRQRARGAVLARIICAVAVFMLGFAGHGFADTPDMRRAEFRLPDGSYASLCQPGGDKNSRHENGRHCDVCVTSPGHLFVPPLAWDVAHFLVFADLADGVDGTTHSRRILSHHGLSRAPPLNA